MGGDQTAAGLLSPDQFRADASSSSPTSLRCCAAPRGTVSSCSHRFVFGLSAIEAAAYVMQPGQVIASSDGATVRRPVIGWGPERAGRFHSEKSDPKTGALIYSADYTIDSNLLRQTRVGRSRSRPSPSSAIRSPSASASTTQIRCRSNSPILEPGRARRQPRLHRLWTAAFPARNGDRPVRLRDRPAAASCSCS